MILLNELWTCDIYTRRTRRKVKIARKYNGAIAVHMIGDKACEMVLDAIENILCRTDSEID